MRRRFREVSYVLSTGVTFGGSRRSTTDQQNIHRRVVVSVVNDTTRKTSPLAVAEAQVLVDESALSAPLGRREETINLDQPAAVPFALVRQLPDELAPSKPEAPR